MIFFYKIPDIFKALNEISGIFQACGHSDFESRRRGKERRRSIEQSKVEYRIVDDVALLPQRIESARCFEFQKRGKEHW